MQVIYFTYNGILESVFESQVMAVLQRLKKSGIDARLAAFDKLQFSSQQMYERRQQIAIELLGDKVGFFSRLPFLGRLGLNAPATRLEQFLAEKCNIHGDGRIILHCKGFVAAYIALKCRKNRPNIKVHADLRGITSEEIYLYLTSSFMMRPIRAYFYHEMKMIEREVLHEADSISCVSNAFRELISSQYPGIGKIAVIPCAVDTTRFNWNKEQRSKMRQNLGLGDSLTLVYSGGQQKWQMLPQLLSKFNQLAAYAKNMRFLVLTYSTAVEDKIMGRFKNLSASAIVINAEHKDIPGYLLAGDLGVIMREHNLVNQVACPTKTAEYMACGLKLLVTPHIGDLDAYIKEFNVGTNFAIDESMLDFHNKLMNMDISETEKNRIASIAVKLFSWDLHIGQLVSIYNDLQ